MFVAPLGHRKKEEEPTLSYKFAPYIIYLFFFQLPQPTD